MDFKTFGSIAGIVGLILAVYVILPLPMPSALGGTSNFDTVELTGLAVGSGCDNEGGSCVGTTITKMLAGTCTAIQKTAGSLAGTSTGQFYCAVSNVASGDQVFVKLPVAAGPNADGNTSLVNGFSVIASYATSSNMIGFNIYNGTGAATSSFAQATTSVQYFVLDN